MIYQTCKIIRAIINMIRFQLKYRNYDFLQLELLRVFVFGYVMLGRSVGSSTLRLDPLVHFYTHF